MKGIFFSESLVALVHLEQSRIKNILFESITKTHLKHVLLSWNWVRIALIAEESKILINLIYFKTLASHFLFFNLFIVNDAQESYSLHKLKYKYARISLKTNWLIVNLAII